jgi:hypothetical protein
MAVGGRDQAPQAWLALSQPRERRDLLDGPERRSWLSGITFPAPMFGSDNPIRIDRSDMTGNPADEDEAPDLVEAGDQVIPKTLQVGLGVILVVFILAALAWLVRYAYLHPETNPTHLRLHEAIVFAIALLVLIVFPWNKLGLRVKKVGWLEFERVVSVQKKEHAQGLVLLDKRFAELEQRFQGRASGQNSGASNPAQVQIGRAGEELQELLLSFLRKYPSYYFNAPRIRNWGSQQPGFRQLEKYSTILITQELHRLLGRGQITTKISRRSGTTLYKIA